MTARQLVAAAIIAIIMSPGIGRSRGPQAPRDDVERRIDALLAKMSLEEKLGQMSQTNFRRLTDEVRDQIRRGRWGSFLNSGTSAEKAEAQRLAMRESRLGIPLIFGQDVIHGHRTIDPIPLGLSATWHPELVERAARLAAREAAREGIRWTFAPMTDVARDPRWGRIAESLGEDPYLAGVMAAAMVRGFQGTTLAAPDSIAACAKHYAGYGAAEAGRDYNSTWIPEPLLRDVYLRPFHAARQAGVATYMTAFNAVNGVPATGNLFLLRRVLRDEWQFDGFVVSDYTAVTEMIQHGYARDDEDAALKAVAAGVDMEMVSTTFHDHVKALLASGALEMTAIDEAVRRILRIKSRLGLFDSPPFAAPSAEAPRAAGEALDLARSVAAESLVLLKNRGGALPLAKTIAKLAVIGPLADSPRDQVGTWAIAADLDAVRTPLAALRAALGDARVAWAPGLQSSRDTRRDGFGAALDAARSADAVLLFLGEEARLSGEAASRAFLNLPGAQEALVDEVKKAGKPMIAIILAGRPLTFQHVAENADAVLYAFHPGTMGGPAIADVVFGDRVPAGKLTATFPRTVGQVPLYYAHLKTGRPPADDDRGIPTGTPLDPKGYTSRYLDVDVTPEYPFGYGLSYTTFEYAQLRVSAPELAPGRTLTVSAEIRNTEGVAADEVVQLYTRQLVGSIARPVRELKGFRRIRLEPGRTATVSFDLTTADLAYYNQGPNPVIEPGTFHVWIAPDSVSGLRGEFRVVR